VDRLPQHIQADRFAREARLRQDRRLLQPNVQQQRLQLIQQSLSDRERQREWGHPLVR